MIGEYLVRAGGAVFGMIVICWLFDRIVTRDCAVCHQRTAFLEEVCESCAKLRG